MDTDFSKRIKQLRKTSDMKQSEMAKLFHVSQQTVGAWETGRSTPGGDMLKRLADYFNVSIDYLLGRTDIKQPAESDTPSTSDLREAAKHAQTFGGVPVTEEDVNITLGLLDAYYKNKKNKK